MKYRHSIIPCFTIFLLVLLGASRNAQAIPNLQIYSPEPNVYYDTDSETWMIPYLKYDLWVIGAHVPIADVKLGLAVPENENGTIEIYSHTHGISTTLHEGLLDITPEPNSTSPFFVEQGVPLMGDGDEVPRGGVFPTSYYQYYIGDFGLDETVQNYIPGPEAGDTALGHIEAFSINVTGYTWVDIIAYDHVVFGRNKVKYVKTPYSHDGGGGGTPVPEPATMVLLGSGLALLGWRGRKK